MINSIYQQLYTYTGRERGNRYLNRFVSRLISASKEREESPLLGLCFGVWEERGGTRKQSNMKQIWLFIYFNLTVSSSSSSTRARLLLVLFFFFSCLIEEEFLSSFFLSVNLWNYTIFYLFVYYFTLPQWLWWGREHTSKNNYYWFCRFEFQSPRVCCVRDYWLMLCHVKAALCAVVAFSSWVSGLSFFRVGPFFSSYKIQAMGSAP